MAVGIANHSTYMVSYNSESHWSVITQMWGSQLPKVLPYCIFNVLLMIVLTVIDKHNSLDMLEISSLGHTFITLVVAFLLVSRVSTALGRFNEARDCLGKMYMHSRELVQGICVFSAACQDVSAQQWRHETTYRSLILLRAAMAVIDFPVTEVTPWNMPELNGAELEDVKKNIYLSPGTLRWGHAQRSEWEESMRVPIRIAYLLRKSIHSQSKCLQDPINVLAENRLHSSVDNFMGGYYGIRKFLTTPVPFPLIQMARTFLFLYVFTVPFVMLSDTSNLFAHCFSVFLLTYGFIGLESVAIELDNPFGDDDNDFNNSAMAMTAYEDTYLTILDVDGPEWTDKLRIRMHDASSGDQHAHSERSWLLEKIV